MLNDIKKHYSIIALVLLLIAASLPATAAASDTSSSDQWLVVTKYEVGGAWVTYYVVVTNWYRMQYTAYSDGCNVYEQTQGGVIKNAQVPGYFPFSQTVSRAWVKRYRNSDYFTNYEFSFDNSGSIYDPNDQPYGFIYNPDVYLYDSDANEMRPFVYWAANGTLPNARSLQGQSLYL